MSAGVERTVRVVGRYDFGQVVEYLRRSPSAVLERVEGGDWERAVRLPSGRAALVRVRPEADGPAAALRVGVLGDGLAETDVDAAVGWAARVLQLGADAAGLDEPAAFAADPVFAGLAARLRGLRPVLIATPFEALVWAILGQQINVAFAAKTKRALVDACGPRVELDGRQVTLFPEPADLARLDPADLRPLQISRQKAESTIAVARAVVEGRLDLDALAADLPPADTPPAAALARLRELKGVGPWTAEYVLMRGFGHPDVIPAGDGGLKQIIGRWYGLGRQATEAEIRQLAERWRPWRGWAGFYWWHALQMRLVSELPA